MNAKVSPTPCSEWVFFSQVKLQLLIQYLALCLFYGMIFKMCLEDKSISFFFSWLTLMPVMRVFHKSYQSDTFIEINEHYDGLAQGKLAK